MSAPEPAAARRREAWGHRDAGARLSDLPHWVDWPAGTYAGRALCGKEIVPARLDPLGTAPLVDVKVCPACVTATGALSPGRGVVDLAHHRANRRLF